MISRDEILVQRRVDGNQLLYKGSVTVEHETLVTPDSLTRARTDPSFFVAQYLDNNASIASTTTEPCASPELDRELVRSMQSIVHDRMYHEARRYLHELIQLANRAPQSSVAMMRLQQINERLIGLGLL